jgi:nitrous oxidase accessory protein
VRHRPAGLVEYLETEQPQAAVFAASPAFDAVRLAESSFPVVEAPGIVDQRPLAEPHHDDWRKYADNS